MKPLTFCSLAFREKPIEALLPWVAKTGFDAIEILGGQLEGLSDSALLALKDQAQDCGVEILSVAPYLWLTQNEELRKESMEIAHKTIHQARTLGAKKIRTFTDSGPTGIGSDVATPEHWEQAVTALKTITASAPELRFVVETHAKTLADTAQSAERLLQKVSAHNLKLLFQPGPHFWIAEFDQLFSEIEHMHLHNINETGAGCALMEGVLDFKTFLQAVKTRGYAHSIALEYCWRGNSPADLEKGFAQLKELI
ncbi:sugar phosphate isomerase/epimerase [Kiritimatiellaeota bacterium B1221]|nr:sugar phosphate isomerase/epimerase [Kiritimatiellaeota bacterium B1221]